MNPFAILLQVPVPHDLPLDLPLPEWLLVGVLIVSFLLHILFVDMMVGGVLLTLWFEIKGLKNKEYDTLAHEIANTVTVNKSMAVVLGVAPLLAINTLYTVYFYSANALTGLMWIMIIPLVIVAFLLTYAHKYSWEKLSDNKPLHLLIIGAAALLFAFIPFIFLTNVNLMLFPEKWGTVHGFLSALMLPNVLPRYVFFMMSTLAITSLFLFWYFGRSSYDFEGRFSTLTRYSVRKRFYSLAFGTLALQVVLAGPILVTTLPAKGISTTLVVTLLGGVVLLAPVLYWLWKGITAKQEELMDRDFNKVLAMTLVITLVMGGGRHLYRENALAPHKKLMAERTAEYNDMVRQAHEQAQAAAPATAQAGGTVSGETIFQQNCSACHAKDVKVVGPPMTEMLAIYKTNPDGLKNWVKAPGKKRPDFPQMPGFAQLSEPELKALADYILHIQ